MTSEEKSILPLSKVYWALMALSLVTFLVGVSPDKSTIYREALDELRQIQKLSPRVDFTYKYVAPSVVKHLGADPILVLEEVIKKSNRKTISSNVLLDIEYFWVDQGPLDLPKKVNDLYEMFQKDVNYAVRVPSVIELKTGLLEAFNNAPSGYNLVSDIDISCNYANLRCNVGVTLNDEPSESNRYHKEFKINATVLDLKEKTFWSKVMRENSYFTKETISLLKVEKVLYEVYDLEIDEAIKSINIKLSSTKGDVSALGLTIKGDAALSILPFLCLSLMFFMIAILREIGKGYDESKYLDTPLFYKTSWGIVCKWVSFIVFPAVSVVILVVRFFEFNSYGSWVGSLSMVGVVVCSHTIANELRKMQSPKPNKKIQPTAESGG